MTDLVFVLRPYLDLDLGGQKFKIAITYQVTGRTDTHTHLDI